MWTIGIDFDADELSGFSEWAGNIDLDAGDDGEYEEGWLDNVE